MHQSQIEGLLKPRWEGAITLISNTAGLCCGRGLAFLTRSHVMLMLLAQGLHFENHCSRRNVQLLVLQIVSLKYNFLFLSFRKLFAGCASQFVPFKKITKVKLFSIALVVISQSINYNILVKTRSLKPNQPGFDSWLPSFIVQCRALIFSVCQLPRI